MTVSVVEHTMSLFNIATGQPFDEFVAAFERAAPAVDPAPYNEIIASGGSWDEVKATVARLAPHDLMIYARIDASAMMALAGHSVRAVEYLLGNHVIAETMFRRNPNAMLYAPLRVLVFSDDSGNAVFAIDRPATVFAGLQDPAITAVGTALDGKVTGLLHALGVEVAFEGRNG